ncbi:MAG: hypothetical protein R3E31_25450 [Chloroflexota bacterium]|nr:hypothetical protein [Anaerolineales bacterium]MCA9979011.1 hypothetical protein [Anaerolineales bacterium]MCB8965428.1 hypothetical protein [Ardenticatenaceae bacterium]
MEDWKQYKRGAGGTPGGLGTFIIGLIMTLVGGYLLLNQIHVSSGFFGWRYGFGGVNVSAFGITLLFFLLGVGLIFFDGRSKAGWLLAGGGLLIIIVGVLATLHVYLRTTSLYILLGILVLFVGGLGLMARSLRAVE